MEGEEYVCQVQEDIEEVREDTEVVQEVREAQEDTEEVQAPAQVVREVDSDADQCRPITTREWDRGRLAEVSAAAAV